MMNGTERQHFNDFWKAHICMYLCAWSNTDSLLVLTQCQTDFNCCCHNGACGCVTLPFHRESN